MIGNATGKVVRFDDRFLHVELTDGRVISTPPALVSGVTGGHLAAGQQPSVHLPGNRHRVA